MRAAKRSRVTDRLTARASRHLASPAAGLTRRLGRLTTREREIVYLVSAGASNKVIAAYLAIAEATVKVHLTAVFRKLGVPGRLPLAVLVLTGLPGRPPRAFGKRLRLRSIGALDPFAPRIASRR